MTELRGTTHLTLSSQHMSKDCCVRVKMISFLVSLGDQPDGGKYLNSLLVLMADKVMIIVVM